MFVRSAATAVVMLAVVGAATPAMGDQVAIAANSTVQGRLEQGDTRRDDNYIDAYVYQGEVGEEVYIRYQTQENGLLEEVRIEGADGFSVGSGSDSDVVVARLPRRGRYRILVMSRYPATYQLDVWRGTAEQQPGELNVGMTVNGALVSTDRRAVFGYQDVFTFNAQAGEGVNFHVEGQRASFRIGVTGPNSFSWGSGAPVNITDRGVLFPSAGAYSVSVEGPGGNYMLGVQPRQSPMTATPIGSLRAGDTVQHQLRAGGVIEVRGLPANIYTIDARRGERLAVVVTPRTGLRVLDASGQVVPTTTTSFDGASSRALELNAPADGQYRLEVSYSDLNGPTEYTLQLLSAAAGASAIADANAAEERRRAERRVRFVAAVQRADQLLNSGHNAEAEAAYREALAIDNTNADAHNRLRSVRVPSRSHVSAQSPHRRRELTCHPRGESQFG